MRAPPIERRCWKLGLEPGAEAERNRAQLLAGWAARYMGRGAPKLAVSPLVSQKKYPKTKVPLPKKIHTHIHVAVFRIMCQFGMLCYLCLEKRKLSHSEKRLPTRETPTRRPNHPPTLAVVLSSGLFFLSMPTSLLFCGGKGNERKPDTFIHVRCFLMRNTERTCSACFQRSPADPQSLKRRSVTNTGSGAAN